MNKNGTQYAYAQFSQTSTFEIKLEPTNVIEIPWVWNLKKYARLTGLSPKITPKQLQMINQMYCWNHWLEASICWPAINAVSWLSKTLTKINLISSDLSLVIYLDQNNHNPTSLNKLSIKSENLSWIYTQNQLVHGNFDFSF